MPPRTSDEIRRPSRYVIEGMKDAKKNVKKNKNNNMLQSSGLRKDANHAGPARTGAVTHAGAAEEVVCYAQI